MLNFSIFLYLNFMLNCVEHEKSFTTSGPGFIELYFHDGSNDGLQHRFLYRNVEN